MRFSLLPLLALAACSSPDIAHDVRGVYHGPAAIQGAVSITHEAVPGVMDAMAMDFVVRDTVGLGALRDGDKVTFRYVLPADGAPYVERLVRLPDTTALRLGDSGAMHDHAAPTDSAHAGH